MFSTGRWPVAFFNDGRLVEQYDCRRWHQLGLPFLDGACSFAVVHDPGYAEAPERPVVEVEPSDERTGIGGGPRGIETDEQGGHGRDFLAKPKVNSIVAHIASAL